MGEASWEIVHKRTPYVRYVPSWAWDEAMRHRRQSMVNSKKYHKFITHNSKDSECPFPPTEKDSLHRVLEDHEGIVMVREC